MKRLLAGALALLCSVSGFAQGGVTVVSKKIQNGSGALLSSGQFCLNGSNCIAVANGATPTTATLRPGAGIVTITSGAQTLLTVPNVTITSTTFFWDGFVLQGQSSGVGIPYMACQPGAVYLQTDAGNARYTCITSNGQNVWDNGAVSAGNGAGLTVAQQQILNTALTSASIGATVAPLVGGQVPPANLPTSLPADATAAQNAQSAAAAETTNRIAALNAEQSRATKAEAANASAAATATSTATSAQAMALGAKVFIDTVNGNTYTATVTKGRVILIPGGNATPTTGGTPTSGSPVSSSFTGVFAADGSWSWGGTSAAIAAGTYTAPYYNGTGQTITLLGVQGYADVGASTFQIFDDQGNALLSAPLTAGLLNPSGTLSTTSLLPGHMLFVRLTADGTTTLASLSLSATHPAVTGTETGVSAMTTPATSAPTASVPTGSYTAAQSETFASATTNAALFYTSDGSTPTTASTAYSSAIPVNATTTFNVVATAPGHTNSTVSTFTVSITAAAPTGTLQPGTNYSGTQQETLATTTSGASIYYTTDGSTPTVNSTLYNGAFGVAASETVNAIAVASGLTNSPEYSAALTVTPIKAGGPYTDNFTSATSGPLVSPPWSPVTSGSLANATASYGGAYGGFKGIATSPNSVMMLYTGGIFGNDQYAEFPAGSGNNQGPVVRGTSAANGYAWLGNYGVVVKLVNGAGSNVVSGCPTFSPGDIIKLSVVGSTLTCLDVTTGASSTGTDSTYTSGTPGFFFDGSNQYIGGFTAGSN